MPIHIINFNTGTNSGNTVGTFDGGSLIITTSGAALYLGDSTTNGSWRMILSGSNLSFQRREAGVYVEKVANTP